MNWQLQDAKAKLSELVKLAQRDGPQAITVHGKLAAVVVSGDEFERLAGHKLSFVEYMQRSPLVGIDLHLRRSRSLPRKTRL